jgi:polyisoprenoid-binding protein YceI
VGLYLPIRGQNLYKQTNASNITLAGTSTLHDWTMTSSETNIQASFKLDEAGIPIQLKSLTLSVPSQSLKSSKKAMDKNAYSALKTEKYKAISFSLASTTVQKNIFTCVGNLSIAGATKAITLDATCEVKPNKTLNCTGKKAIKMSDYQVEAPSFMFGTVKTGDEITVSFNVELAPIKN